MSVSVIKDTIEIKTMLLDDGGNGFVQKRINLREGFAHQLIQTDIFFDSWIGFDGQKTPFEVTISPYPQIPTKQGCRSSPRLRPSTSYLLSISFFGNRSKSIHYVLYRPRICFNKRDRRPRPLHQRYPHVFHDGS